MNGEKAPVHLRIEPLGPQHERGHFSCGVAALDRYLQKQASQDIGKYAAATFVITPDGTTIAGFCTLSAHSIHLADLPGEMARRLPRYPNVPATLLGRLAVSAEFRGHGIDEFLLIDALRRVLSTSKEIASAAVVIDAKDESARQFYLHYGFIPLPAQPNRMLYPVSSIAKLFGRSPKQ